MRHGTHLDTVISLFDAQLYFAVQEDFTVPARKLEGVEAEVVGGSLSVAYHPDGFVVRVGTAVEADSKAETLAYGREQHRQVRSLHRVSPVFNEVVSQVSGW